MDWVSLHSHSTYSFLDGFAQPQEHVERAAELGMTALALTEHGNISSHVRLEQAAARAGINPIFGLEAYTAPADMREQKLRYKWHLGILAMNQFGYRNLTSMVTESWTEENHYYEPTITGSSLARHADGISVLSGCTGSLLACALLGGKGQPDHVADVLAASDVAARFRDLLGNNYYLEVQAFPELERTLAINPVYERIGRKLGIPLVATCDVHYPQRADNKMQVLLHATGRGGVSSDRQEQTWEYDIRLTYPKSDAQLWKKLCKTGLSPRAASAAIENSAILASRCNVVLPRASRVRYPVEAGESAMGLLSKWVANGFAIRDMQITGEYADRISREMHLIFEKDFADFFLVTADAIQFAKREGIAVGPARGSAAASLVCYMLQITEIDPLQYPAMMLERFLDPSRRDAPDIDLDFDDERRDEIRLYLVGKYGEQMVGNVQNFVRFRGKSAVKAAAHAGQVPKAATEAVCELIIERGDGDARQFDTVTDTIGLFPGVADVFAEHPSLKLAQKLEGNLRGPGVHAAGLIVSTEPLTNFAALYNLKSGSGSRARRLSVLSADKWDAEYLGCLKMDFLGLTTMGMIARACDLAGVELEELYRVRDDDSAVMEGFRDNDVTGIFQFEGRATRAICEKVRPVSFMELADINALSRPGPLNSGTTAAYIAAGRNSRNSRNLAGGEAMAAIVTDTRGQIVYQEQILKVATDIGGFDWAAASRLRKVISKKLGQAQFNELFSLFAEGALRLHGIDEEGALQIWKRLVTSAAYAFNIAHSVSYAKLAIWAMWLKQYFPAEFFTASLQKAADSETTARLLRDAESHDIEIGRPSVANPSTTWTLHGTTIIPGYEQIPGIGEATARAILDYEPPKVATLPWLLQVKGVGPKMAHRLFEAGWPREAGPVQGLGPAMRAALAEAAGKPDGLNDWGDLTKIPGVGPSTAEVIRNFVAAEDPFGLYRGRQFAREVREMVKAGKLAVPLPTHNSSQLGGPPGKVTWAGLVREIVYRDLAEDERAAGNEAMEGIKSPHLTRSVTLKCYDDGDDEVYIRIGRFEYRKFARQVARITPGSDGIVVTGKKYPGFGASIRASKIFILEP